MSKARKTAACGATQRSAGTACAVLAMLPLLLTTCFLLSPAASRSVQAQTAAKVVEGKVYGPGTAPLPGSIVYLQDQNTNVVKTFISTADGSYRFGQLPADTDYKVWARYKDKQSKSRVISSFDTKLDVTIDFHIQ